MSAANKRGIAIPSLDELQASVVQESARRGTDHELIGGTPGPGKGEFGDIRLTPSAEDALRYAANHIHQQTGLKAMWAAVNVTSGSVKKRILDELYRHGLIKLDSLTDCKAVQIYKKGWGYLGRSAPTGNGRGGSPHQHYVAMLAKKFKKKGYDVRVEFEVGRARKRVDLVAFGEKIIGIELAMTSVDQEIKNLKADLATNVLDLVLVVSPGQGMLKRIRHEAVKDAYLAPRMSRVRFFRLTEEWGE